uniref:Uncharacterized protein n=1 Tax=Cyanoderma ruficeps TaxID=181631 RepID=A0A8C3QTW2_9PASS
MSRIQTKPKGRVTQQGVRRTRGAPAARPCPGRPGQEQGKDARPCQGRPRPPCRSPRPLSPDPLSGPVGVEAVQRVGAVAGGELAAEIADVQAALLAQAQAAAPRRVLVREQRARLLRGQELLVRLLGHGGGRGGNASGSGGSASGTRRRRRRHQRPVPGHAALSRRLLPAPRPRSAPCRGEGARRAGGAAMVAGVAQGLGDGRAGRGFLGPRVPAEVEAMSRGMQNVGKETFRRLLNVTVNALEGKDHKESVRLIAESANLSEEQLAFLISGMYTLLQEALRLPLSTFKQEKTRRFHCELLQCSLW